MTTTPNPYHERLLADAQTIGLLEDFDGAPFPDEVQMAFAVRAKLYIDTLRAARDELKLHGWGDFHYGSQGQDRKIVNAVQRCNDVLGDGPYDPDADRKTRFGQ